MREGGGEDVISSVFQYTTTVIDHRDSTQFYKCHHNYFENRGKPKTEGNNDF